MDVARVKALLEFLQSDWGNKLDAPTEKSAFQI
jgi:hypothetical protein